MRVVRALFATALCAVPLCGQMTLAQHLAAGDSLRAALRSDMALRHYEAAVALAPSSYEANWKAAREISDVAKQLLGDQYSSRRDSLYTRGRGWAEAALQLDSNDANGHFTLALVLGRLSRTRSGKERVKFAKIIYDEASRAIQLDSTYDGAWHILGMWNAEVKRLSGFTRFFAKTLFGAGFMDRANWEDAVRAMERAVALRPSYIYHRLELASVYLDVGEPAKAATQLERIPSLPLEDPMDSQYRRTAAQALDLIRRDKADDARDLLRKG